MQWDSEQYWNKAVLYAERAVDDAREVWEQPFWSALALELLARAALTKIHPALNADPRDEGQHLLYAFGFPIKGQPRSIPAHSVFARLERVVPGFDKPTRDFCEFFAILRNQEVHTSELPFEKLAEKKWLPRYFAACELLAAHLGKTLADLVGPDQAATATKLIHALKSDKVATVKQRIADHRKDFGAKSGAQRAMLVGAQEGRALGFHHAATFVPCPACTSPAMLRGGLERSSPPMLKGDELVVLNTYLASELDCGACGLRLGDVQEIHHAELDPHFTEEEHTDLHEYFEPDDYDEYMNM